MVTNSIGSNRTYPDSIRIAIVMKNRKGSHVYEIISNLLPVLVK